MVHANGVDLLFVTLDTVRGTNIVSEEPGLRGGLSTEGVGNASSKHGGGDSAKIPVNGILSDEFLLHRRFHLLYKI
jgi:hypothetical protein